jgi:hypothetical protein
MQRLCNDSGNTQTRDPQIALIAQMQDVDIFVPWRRVHRVSAIPHFATIKVSIKLTPATGESQSNLLS